jgi:hypothetical protein
MKGIGPAVMEFFAVKLFQMAPYAFRFCRCRYLIATIIALMVSRIGAVKLMIAGSVLRCATGVALSFPGMEVGSNIGSRPSLKKAPGRIRRYQAYFDNLGGLAP